MYIHADNILIHTIIITVIIIFLETKFNSVGLAHNFFNFFKKNFNLYLFIYLFILVFRDRISL